MTFMAGFLNGLIKKINEQSCESSSRSTPGSQLLVIPAISQDFVWEMYENQALDYLMCGCHQYVYIECRVYILRTSNIQTSSISYSVYKVFTASILIINDYLVKNSRVHRFCHHCYLAHSSVVCYHN